MIDLRDPNTDRDSVKFQLASNFIKGQHGVVREKDWTYEDVHADIIAYDNNEGRNELVFAEVVFNDNDTCFDDLDTEEEIRSKLEAAAITYLKLHPQDASMKVRFDRIEMIAISADSVLIRHHMRRLELAE